MTTGTGDTTASVNGAENTGSFGTTTWFVFSGNHARVLV